MGCYQITRADKINQATILFNKHKIKYKEKKGGTFEVNKILYYSNTESWYDPETTARGKDFNSFLDYYRLKEVMRIE